MRETIDLLGQVIDREEPTIEDEDSGYKVDENSDQEEAFCYDWMYLESRDIDRNHDWVNDAQKNYSAKDLSNAREFLNQASTNIKEVSRENDEDNVDIQNLNQNQKMVH